MERRQSIREKAPGNIVYMYYLGKRVHRCITHDISAHGAFVKIHPLAVPARAIVQLVFLIKHGRLIQTIRKSAIITRVSNQGAGVGFLNKRRTTCLNPP